MLLSNCVMGPKKWWTVVAKFRQHRSITHLYIDQLLVCIHGLAGKPARHPPADNTLQSVHSINALRYFFVNCTSVYTACNNCNVCIPCLHYNPLYSQSLKVHTRNPHNSHAGSFVTVLCLDVIDIGKHYMHTGDPVSALCLKSPKIWLWLLLAAVNHQRLGSSSVLS